MIIVKIKNQDRSSLINWQSLNIQKNLTNQVDTAEFQIMDKGYIPEITDEVEIYNGLDKIFGGYITEIEEELTILESGFYKIRIQDYSYDLAGKLVAKSYTNQTGAEIIQDMISEFAPEFTTTNVVCNVNIRKIVFNQVPITECLTRISKIIGYEWFVDQHKDIHFFERFSLVAPFNLTDTGGNYIYRSLKRTIDGSQIANQVKVRGGLGTEESLFEDVITVKGANSLSFVLPYKFAGLKIYLNDVEKTVGADGLQDFDTHDVLYSYISDSIRFETVLADGDAIKFTGYRKYPVMAIISNDASISEIGLREKMIVDNTLEDQITARSRARLELDLSADSVTDCTFRTYEAGLECGMRLTIGSEKRGVSEMDFIINRIIFSTRTPEDFEYRVTASTARKMGLTEFLKELARRGDSFREDEKEVAEVIRTDNSDFEITEEIEAIGASEDESDFEIEENVTNTEAQPIWVFGPYHPINQEDPKRMARFDRGSKFS